MSFRPCPGVLLAALFSLFSGSAWAAEVPPVACFAPGTPEHVVRRYASASRFAEHSLLGTGERFQLNSRWSSTATDGGGLGQGDPMTLTWSVVPDGTVLPAQITNEVTSPSNLRAFLDGIYPNTATWLAVFTQVFNRWGELTGVTYLYEPNDDGAAFGSTAGALGVRGDVRIGGHPIDGNSNVLGYNFYPSNGDMVLDSPDSFYNNTGSNSLRLRNVLAHEHGHGLGLRHVCPVNSTKLMEPYLTTAFDGPQHDDIRAGNRYYGDDFEEDDASGTAADLGAIGSVDLGDVSIDDNSDIDYYSFTVAAGTVLEATLSPVGQTYLEGPQNGSTCSAGTNFNSTILHDLGLEVIDGDGSTVLGAADAGGLGASETLGFVPLLDAGTYYVRVNGDSADDAQLYRLELQATGGAYLFDDGFESGDTSAWSSTVP